MSLAPAWQAWWAKRASRERWILSLGGSLVGVALVWHWLIKPPMQLLRQSSNLHAQADANLAQMQAWANQAQSYRGGGRISNDEAIKSLDTLVKAQLGAGSGLTVVADQATVNLRAVPGPVLMDFLRNARTQARALPSVVQLSRPIVAGGAAPVGASVLWDGKIVFTIHAGGAE